MSGAVPRSQAAEPAAPARREPSVAPCFPPEVWSIRGSTAPAATDLPDAEAACVARAVDVRRREFAAGRRLARTLLAGLGHPGAIVLPDADRAPRWPAGLVGSISHGAGVCVVVLAREAHVAGLGVDVEDGAPLEPGLWPHVCTPRELAALAAWDDPAERGRRAKWIFSAKESAYKCLFPAFRRRLGFQDVEIDFHPGAGRFEVRLPAELAGRLARRPGPAGRIEGRLRDDGAHVITGATLRAVAVRARPPAASPARDEAGTREAPLRVGTG